MIGREAGPAQVSRRTPVGSSPSVGTPALQTVLDTRCDHSKGAANLESEDVRTVKRSATTATGPVTAQPDGSDSVRAATCLQPVDTFSAAVFGDDVHPVVQAHGVLSDAGGRVLQGLAEELIRHGARCVRLELCAVTSADLAGVDAICAAWQALLAAGTTVVVSYPAQVAEATSGGPAFARRRGSPGD